MKLLRFFFAVIIFSSNSTGIELNGEMIQGGLITGKVAPGTELIFNKQQVYVNEQGDFAFGFGRDEKPNGILKILKKNQKEQLIRLKIKQRDYKIQRINGLPQDKVTPRTKKQKDKIIADRILVKQARQVVSSQAQFLKGFIWPAAGRISGVYGSQRVLNGEPRRPHFGVDIANHTGSKVIAPAGGVVVLAEADLYFSGGTVIVDHGGGIFSSFLHLSKINVSLNQTVKQGEIIALIGATGRVTGPHLDWRINWFNVRLDPALLVSGKPPKNFIN